MPVEIQKPKNSNFIKRLYSKIPSLYIFINIKNTGLKNALLNIKGYNAIKKNDLLDIGYYLNRNRHIKISGMDPILLHLSRYNEERNPSPTFDGEYYYNKYPDVQISKLNPLFHYSLFCLNENRLTKAKKDLILKNNQILS